MDPASGIVRTASGRQTYAPDGIIEAREMDRHTSETLSTSTSRTLEGAETPEKAGIAGYLTKDGKEAAEDPIEPETVHARLYPATKARCMGTAVLRDTGRESVQIKFVSGSTPRVG